MPSPEFTATIDSMPLPPVRALAVASGKGGVGKTCVSVNLSVALARMRQTLLLDTDLSLANVDVMLGLSPTKTLADVVAGTCSIRDVILTGPEGLLVLPSASGRVGMADLLPSQHVGLVHAVSELDLPISHLVIDNAAGVDDRVLTFCRAAHEVIVVVCDDPASITDSYSLIKLLSKERGVRHVHVLCNQVEDQIHGRRLYAKLTQACDRFLDVGHSHLGSIPRDPSVIRAAQRQCSVMTAYPGSPAAKAFNDIAQRIVAWSAPVAPSGHVEFFMERLLAPAVCAA